MLAKIEMQGPSPFSPPDPPHVITSPPLPSPALAEYLITSIYYQHSNVCGLISNGNVWVIAAWVEDT